MQVCGSGIIFVALIVSVYGQAIFYPGGRCEFGRKVGEQWARPGCVGCYCEQGGYACYGCGSTPPMTPGSGCTLKMNSSAPYPRCCPAIACPITVG